MLRSVAIPCTVFWLTAEDETVKRAMELLKVSAVFRKEEDSKGKDTSKADLQPPE